MLARFNTLRMAAKPAVAPRIAMNSNRVMLSRTFAAKSLYVGNLPWSVSENELKTAMTEFAPVQGVKIPLDRETGR